MEVRGELALIAAEHRKRRWATVLPRSTDASRVVELGAPLAQSDRVGSADVAHDDESGNDRRLTTARRDAPAHGAENTAGAWPITPNRGGAPMTRQVLDDGGWFDADRAEQWEEATRWDGNNHISRATGSQWAHECLYRTRKGVWVLHAWSQWQGSTPRWHRVSAPDAIAWLLRNDEAAAAERYGAAEVQAAEA